jgi:hypothetical protein
VPVPLPIEVLAVPAVLIFAAPVTVNPVNVPTEVKDDPVTPAANVAPVNALAGAEVAAIVPVPVAANDAPVPITNAPVVFVALVIPLNGVEVAAIVPVPLVVKDPPVPTVIVAVEFVPVVNPLNELAGTAAHDGMPADKVKTWPFDPAPSLVYAPAPVP